MNHKEIIGGFYYKGHYVEVSGPYLIKSIFSKTGKKIKTKRSKISDLEVFNDVFDSHNRQYLFIKNQFYLYSIFRVPR